LAASTERTLPPVAGVVGVVWKQNDRYYVRGAPIAENGGLRRGRWSRVCRLS
jgi:hypothetical protein